MDDYYDYQDREAPEDFDTRYLGDFDGEDDFDRPEVECTCNLCLGDT